jgi:hypothetical protein
MSIYVVPQIAWGHVLAAFSRLHRGWLADVRGAEPVGAFAPPAAWRPLAAVTLTSPTGAPSIRIDFTDGASVNVPNPRELRLESRHDGAERALEVDCAAGENIRLVFRATAPAEELDGIAPVEVDGAHMAPASGRSRVPTG